MGYQIIAIAADRPSKLQESVDKHDLGFQLLSDSTMTAAMEFGLAWQAPQSLIDRYLTYNMDLAEAAGQSHAILPVPAVFIVGKDAVVRFQYVNPNHGARLDAEILLAAARVLIKDLAD